MVVIHREDQDSIAVLRLEHGKVQALDLELLEEIEWQLTAIAEGSASAVVLTGTGSSFSAGVDLFRLLDSDSEYRARFLSLLSASLLRLFTCPQPVVGAINGHAIAGGAILAAACDHAVMADGRSRIGVPELLVGVPFPVVAIEILRARLAPHALSQLINRGSLLNASDAAARGLVDDAVPAVKVRERALEAARELAAIPTDTWRINKQQLRQPALDAIERDEPRYDTQIRAAWESAETHAAIRAYLERTLGRS